MCYLPLPRTPPALHSKAYPSRFNPNGTFSMRVNPLTRLLPLLTTDSTRRYCGALCGKNFVGLPYCTPSCTWRTALMDGPHVQFIFVFSAQPCVWQKVGQYLLSWRTHFWRKGKREFFQALKTKDPAPRCNRATGQRWTCPRTHWRSKGCFIPKEHWGQIIQSTVKSACSLYSKGSTLPSQSQEWPPCQTHKPRRLWLQTALNASVLGQGLLYTMCLKNWIFDPKRLF